MSEKFPIRFDASRLIEEEFGGTDKTYQALRSVGCMVERKTVQKWRERGTVPSHALAALALFKQRGGETMKLDGYLLEKG